jgi:hypothetical protein
MNEVLVELYSKDDCHLCDVAREVILAAQKHHPFRLVEIKIRPGTPEYEQFKERIPVIFVNKKFAFQYHVEEGELIRMVKGRGE